MTPLFILASSSPRRRELLAKCGLSFHVVKPEIDESQQDGEAPLDYVRRLSQEKARRACDLLAFQDDALVLAADTVVILGADTLGITGEGDILGKPADADEARTMLQRLRGRGHLVCTALTLLQIRYGESALQIQGQESVVTQTTVVMRDYNEREIEDYIATGDPYDKAGGYAIQHAAFHPVARIEGSYSNVVGLPLETLQKMLSNIGITIHF